MSYIIATIQRIRHFMLMVFFVLKGRVLWSVPLLAICPSFAEKIE